MSQTIQRNLFEPHLDIEAWNARIRWLACPEARVPCCTVSQIGYLTNRRHLQTIRKPFKGRSGQQLARYAEMQRTIGSGRETRVEKFSGFLAALQKLTEQFNREENSRRSLERFIAEFARLKQTEPPRPKMVESVDVSRFEGFIGTLGSLAQELRMRGDFIDVWEIAGLKRNELRTAAVLAWLFDPKQTHGRGTSIFVAFIRRLAQNSKGSFPLPASICGNYAVSPENAITESSRIDIAIDGPDFIAFVEVKIDASEREGKILEYLSLARTKAAGRPYCVIFLSPQGPSVDSPNIVAATWNDVAIAIEEVVGHTQSSSGGFGDRLLRQFAQYIRKF